MKKGGKMKNLKRLTRTMKEIVARHGLEPDEWGLVFCDKNGFRIHHRKTDETKYFEF